MKTWVEQLVPEYNKGKNKLDTYRRELNRSDPDGLNPVTQEEITAVGEMVGDMHYAIEWMRSGRQPGTKRGIDRKGVYGRAALLDPKLFPSLDVEPSERELSEEERRQIADILWKMSARERQCYLLHVSYGRSFADIGKELKISKRSVQQYVDRAKKKIIL